jgi:3-phosphoshikimate 1-carboxyvinyltransferase
MIYRISHPTKIIKGEITLTASKSESNRALIIQAVCADSFEIKNLAKAEDTQTLQRILQEIKTNAGVGEHTYNVGAAGTTMRFLTAYLATQQGTHILTGSERMKNRPIGVLVDALRDLGADIEYLAKEGYPPLQIKGKELTGSDVLIDGSVSSQYITALLLIAPTLKNGLSLRFTGEVTSRPYISMTLKMLKEFGVDANWDEDTITIIKTNYKTTADYTYYVEGDWSSASYWYAFAALAKEANLTINGLKNNSLQGDSVVADIFNFYNVNTVFNTENNSITISNTVTEPKGNFDFSDCPDLAQTVAAVTSALGITVKFSGLHTLRIKETDRSLALQIELKKLGTDVKMFGDDTIVITPGRLNLAPTSIATYEDHRMAMAFAAFALVCNYIDIEESEVVRKSYPDFWDDLKNMGFVITTV